MPLIVPLTDIMSTPFQARMLHFPGPHNAKSLRLCSRGFYNYLQGEPQTSQVSATEQAAFAATSGGRQRRLASSVPPLCRPQTKGPGGTPGWQSHRLSRPSHCTTIFSIGGRIIQVHIQVWSVCAMSAFLGSLSSTGCTHAQPP